MTLTRSQIEQLGIRLIATDQPADEDLALLHELLLRYDTALRASLALVHERLGVLPTSRIKNTGTILEKLRRHGGSWLKSLQDIAGMRIVAPSTRDDQDVTVDQIVTLFSQAPRRPRVIDRRKIPKHGYTAVHVVVYPDGVPVEIQVRTPWQHAWAEQFEKLADIVGRGIRYGEPPDHWWDENQRKRATPDQRRAYDQQYAARADAVKATQALVDVVERADQSSGDPVRDVSDPLVLIALLTFNEISVIRPLVPTPTTITP